MITVVMIINFDLTETIGLMDGAIKGKRQEKKSFEDAAYAKQKEIDEIRKQAWYFLAIAKMAGWSRAVDKGYDEKREYWQWYDGRKDGRSDTNKTEWRQVHYFRMVGFEFAISIAERFDLKRDKFAVEIHGFKQVPSVHSHDVGWYGEHDYLKNLYGVDNLSKKFRTLQDANEFMENWKVKLYEGHKIEIEKQLQIAETITPEQAEYAEKRRYV